MNLEDISAPRCFEIERRLRESLDIPVFHDDQHGTAVVVLAALHNALRLVEKDTSDIRVVMMGAGAAGVAVARLLMESGVQDIIIFDSKGPLYPGRDRMDEERTALAAITNPRKHAGSVTEALEGADVFIGLSQPNVITGKDVQAMAEDAIVFALAKSRPRDRPRHRRQAREGCCHRPQRLPKSDQQRAGLPPVFSEDFWIPGPTGSPTRP